MYIAFSGFCFSLRGFILLRGCCTKPNRRIGNRHKTIYSDSTFVQIKCLVNCIAQIKRRAKTEILSNPKVF